MLAALLITFREGLEAALIVGILLGYLRKVPSTGLRRYAWAGVLAALVTSAGLAGLIQLVGFELQGRAEMLFEAGTMFLAVGILTWMIFWMRYQARVQRSELEQALALRVGTRQSWGVAALASIAVFREGVETALFLSAAAFANPTAEPLTGALIGLVLAVAAGYLVYNSSLHLNLRLFFSATSLLLLLFAAGLMAQGVHELQEAALIPVLDPGLWNTNFLINEHSLVGKLLQSVVGYNANPSLTEVLTYLGYWLVALVGVRWLVDRKVTHLAAESQPLEV
jgi:high-affinity iron transporter